MSNLLQELDTVVSLCYLCSRRVHWVKTKECTFAAPNIVPNALAYCAIPFTKP
jgi:hypothetical protein